MPAKRKTSKTPVINKEFNITWVKPKEIKLWDQNPRFNDEASVKLAKVIAENGFRSPIVCWDKDNQIYKGLLRSALDRRAPHILSNRTLEVKP